MNRFLLFTIGVLCVAIGGIVFTTLLRDDAKDAKPKSFQVAEEDVNQPAPKSKPSQTPLKKKQEVVAGPAAPPEFDLNGYRVFPNGKILFWWDIIPEAVKNVSFSTGP